MDKEPNLIKANTIIGMIILFTIIILLDMSGVFN